jgi:hypothetical protein
MALPSVKQECPRESMSRRVALVTCSDLPQLDEDTRRLIAPLAARGVSATPAVWDDRNVDWSLFDLVVVRSCWDYVPRRDEFLEWAERVPHLANSAALLTWNTDKGYLRDLAARGIPIVPTTWLKPADDWTPPATDEWVVKPVVSMASLDTGRYRLNDCRVPRRRLLETSRDRLPAPGSTGGAPRAAIGRLGSRRATPVRAATVVVQSRLSRGAPAGRPQKWSFSRSALRPCECTTASFGYRGRVKTTPAGR